MGRAFEYRKARKFARWDKMAKTFTRIGKEIEIAVKSGGASVDTNARLRALVQNARAENMPKENVERAIKRAISKDTTDYKELLYEGYGPYGIAFVIETATDNHVRTVANIRSYFNKYNGSLGTQGSVEFMFDHKCLFTIKNNSLDIEELEFELIDFGAEEVFEDEDTIMIYGEFANFGSLQKVIEDKGLEIIKSGFERIPQQTKELTEEQQTEINKLIDRLEEDDDVQNIYHNIA
ncbi:MAG: YebC/PmpR family DNA-binding transcriptional regulator [Bacteroidetes bacterium]|nr:YebC/PmpR family DNA-binding transcriptional regulator [Bacteroidota bacterium]